MSHLIGKFLHQRDNLPRFKCSVGLKVDLERDECFIKTNWIINSKKTLALPKHFEI